MSDVYQHTKMVAYTERNISTEMFHGVCYIIVTCIANTCIA